MGSFPAIRRPRPRRTRRRTRHTPPAASTPSAATHVLVLERPRSGPGCRRRCQCQFCFSESMQLVLLPHCRTPRRCSFLVRDRDLKCIRHCPGRAGHAHLLSHAQLPACFQFLAGAVIIMLHGPDVQRVLPFRRGARRAGVRLAHEVAAEPQLRHSDRERALTRHRHLPLCMYVCG